MLLEPRRENGMAMGAPGTVNSTRAVLFALRTLMMLPMSEYLAMSAFSLATGLCKRGIDNDLLLSVLSWPCTTKLGICEWVVITTGDE